MKKISRIFSILAVLAAFLMLSGCTAGYRDLKITSFREDSVSMPSIGTRSISFKFRVGVQNPSAKLSIEDISGSVKNGDREIGTFYANPVTVLAKSEQEYVLEGRISLNSSVSLLELATLRPEKLTMNIYFKARSRGFAKKIKYEDVPLNEALGRLQNMVI